jgi:hypothetical protein
MPKPGFSESRAVKNVTISLDEAMHRFPSKAPVRLRRPGKRYPTRDELHDGDDLR